ncbi:DUF455 family protein [Nonomuraea sp. KM88]|uniref:DUF455 family protein n=1 Tax=Nonomuraea sp. KM88 TaxID=3457427 RepID=UPI003FCE02B8
MTEKAPPDVAESRRSLQILRYACVRLLEISAGALVRVADSRTKVALSRDVWSLAQAADHLGRRLPGLRSSAEAMTPVAGYAEFTNGLIRIGDPAEQYDLLVSQAFPELRDVVCLCQARHDQLADEASVSCLKSVAEQLDKLTPPTGGATSGGRGELARGIEGLDRDEQIPPPLSALESIPRRPGREAGLAEGASSASGLVRHLHDMIFGIEICAAEICAALIAHHPEAPWGLRYDLAKQVRDEGRHFELIANRISELGGQIGDHPIKFDVWDKFTLGRTLPERINIEQRMGEGIGLDGGMVIYRALKKMGDERTALLFDYINADEVTHVGNGNRWLRELLGSDEAVAALDAETRRLLAAANWPTVSPMPLNVEDRILAGFTEAELAELRPGT